MLEEIKVRIEREIPQSEAIPYTADNHHFEVQVVSETFEGKSLLARHRMVYDALGDLMQEIHALAMDTKTPGESK